MTHFEHDHRHRTTACPRCLAMLDASAGAEGPEPPVPGDVTVCLYCTTILIFDEDLRLREPTPEQRAELEASPRWELVRRIQRAINAALQPRKAGLQ